MSRTALIDGDIIVYACAWASEEPIDWGDSTTLEVDHAAVAAHIDERICDIEADVDSDRSLVCLSPGHVFRHDLFPEYKANRKGEGKRKPIGYKAARDYLRATYEVVQRAELEADDVMGIIATGGSRKYAADEYVICSTDKDMAQIPGLHYKWNREEDGVFEISEDEAERKFWTQVLTGDSTDNIAGIPGVGPVKAGHILDDARGMTFSEGHGFWEKVVVPAYEKAGLTEHEALLTARLVRILRAGEYDNRKKEPILWTP